MLISRRLAWILSIVLNCRNILPAQSTAPKIDLFRDFLTHGSKEDQITFLLFGNLARACQFQTSHIGASGEISDNTKMFRNILASKQAKIIFKLLEKDSAIVGQLYAMCGLYLIDKDQFNKQKSKYLTNDTRILIINGCVSDITTVEKLFAEILKGEIPKQLASDA